MTFVERFGSPTSVKENGGESEASGSKSKTWGSSGIESLTIVTEASGRKIAVTWYGASMTSVHGPEPATEQGPFQPTKTDPASGMAVRVTSVPTSKSSVQ